MSLSRNDIQAYVTEHIGDFHQRRLDSLARLDLENLLKRKNPYLFRAKNVLTAEQLVRVILDAHLSSQEEAIFGDFLEGLAIFVASKTYSGHKSATDGIDLEFVRDDVLYVVSIKSGPIWGNSQQIKRMVDTFNAAKRRLATSRSTQAAVYVNGCCYGQTPKAAVTAPYLKLCGQQFWELMSGDDRLYVDIVEPLGHDAKSRNEEFEERYAQVVNQMTLQLLEKFTANGLIDWEKLVEFNSGPRRHKPRGK